MDKKVSGKAYVYGKTERLSILADAINKSSNSKALEKELKVDFEECYDDDDKWEVESLDSADDNRAWLVINYFGGYFWAQLSNIVGEHDLDDEDLDIEVVDYVNYDKCETNDAYALSVRDRYCYCVGNDRSSYYETLQDVISEVKKKYGVPVELTEKWDVIRWCFLEKDIDLSIEELSVQYYICAPWTREKHDVIRLM